MFRFHNRLEYYSKRRQVRGGMIKGHHYQLFQPGKIRKLVINVILPSAFFVGSLLVMFLLTANGYV